MFIYFAYVFICRRCEHLEGCRQRARFYVEEGQVVGIHTHSQQLAHIHTHTNIRIHARAHTHTHIDTYPHTHTDNLLFYVQDRGWQVNTLTHHTHTHAHAHTHSHIDKYAHPLTHADNMRSSMYRWEGW